ncbi:Arylsulfatase [Pontiella desulfatans]|uniref:Arylsulfatase n=1 Tax=Pontiella desulfatans TaxID=2750659 RepID=A0A6C2TYS2_PONDE|nr:sulfatase [Pontiella desulfatans]SPS73676.1 sulfatase S1_16 [Kiritimatiellales bacterium]VGO12501.1 Arylsulfatase [Pontiella desulfatans]
MKSMWAGIVLIGAVCVGYAETVLINDDFSVGTVGTSLTIGAANDGQWYAENGSVWTITNGVLGNAGGSSDVSNNEGSLAQLVDLSGITDTNLSSLTLSFLYQGNSATEELYVHLWGMNFATAPADGTSVVNHGATAGNMWKIGASSTAFNNGDLYNLGNLNGEFFNVNVGAYQEAAVRIPTTGTDLVNFSQTFDLSVNTNGMDNIAAFDYLVIGITRDANGTDPSIVIDDFMLAVSDPSDNPRPAQPNFILLLADDLGWQDVGCYDIDNNQVFDTPYMDNLATEGTRFTQAYSPACVCAPTRAAILTGKHPARLNFTTVSGGSVCPQPSDLSSRVMTPYHHRRLEAAETTLPEVLKTAGYYNGHIGKWHMDGPDELEQGFDYSDGDRGATITLGDRTSGFSDDLDENGFAYDQTTENALGFLSSATETNQPFFCYFATYLVHSPWHIRTESLLQKYADRMGYDYPLTGEEYFAPGQNNPYYGAMVETFDYYVHRVMTYLKETDDPRWPGHKLIENTYIFLTSDNGGMENGDSQGKVTDNYPLDQGKIFQEEGGLRVPFFVVGPGISTNVVSDVMVNGLDFYPTLLSLAGIDIPSGIDGCDISELLLTDPQDEELVTDEGGDVRDTMYWSYPHISGTRMNATMRKDRWKLFLNYDHVNNAAANEFRLYELYDTNGVRVDIEEANDVWNADLVLTEQLGDSLKAWLDEVDANVPHYNPHYTGSPSLPNQDQVPGVITNGNGGGGVVWVEYETDKAAMKRVDLLYTRNGESSSQTWLRKEATITASGRAEGEVPEGTTHYVFNLIDENNFLVSYPDVGTGGDGLLDSAFAISYVELPYVNPAPQVEIFSEDFSGATLDTAGLKRDSVGFCIGGSSAWAIDNGELVNTSLVNTTVSEGAAGCIIDLSTLENPSVSEFTLSFDYALAEDNETLYVHVWGYQDHSSTPTTAILNHGASNGNAWEDASPAMTAYNFGNSNGVWVGTKGIASDAAVAVSGFQGMTSYARTFDLSAFTSAPNQLGEYDYLVIGFARNFSGSAPAATVDNVKVKVPSSTIIVAESTNWSSLVSTTNDSVEIESGVTVTVDVEASARSLRLDGLLLFKLGVLGADPLTLEENLAVGSSGSIVVDGSDYEALDGYMPLIYNSMLDGSLTSRVSFVGFEGREPAVVILDEGMWLRLVEPPSLSERICSVAPASTANADYTDSIFSATRGFKLTGSAWGSLYDESVVMNTTLEQTVMDGGSGALNQSWSMTIGHGGQIASLRTPALGETVPPQYQSNPGSAPWIDEVWQSVAIDQTLNNSYDNAPYFIHQAGVYPTKDDELTEAFYSPAVAAYVNEENRSFMMINWGQHAHLQVYTNSIPEDDWRSDLLYFTGVKDLGDGVIEVSQGYYNYGVDNPTYFNMPWGGVRRTSTEYCFFNDPSGTSWSDPMTAHFGDGVKTNYSDTGGAMAWSASTNGTTPCLGLVFGQDPDPLLPNQKSISWMRYGHHGTFSWDETSWRNYYVISAIRQYYLTQGRGVWSRYYFVLGDNLDDIQDRIDERELTAVPSLEPFDYTEANTPLVAYSYTGSGADLQIVENSTSPQFFLYAYPVNGSFPIYEILEDDETYHITWDPYATGVIKTYDGTIAGIRLLGFAPRTADVSGSPYTYESLDTLMAPASQNYIASGETLSARTATSFETWKVQYFGMTDDSGDGASIANPDNDSADNLIEYAMGGDPLDDSDTGYVPTSGMLAENGTNWFEFVHPRRIGAEGEIAYRIESSSNLISNDWKTAAHTELPMTGSLDAAYEAVTNRIDTTGKTNEFIRLKVEAL